MPVPACPGIQHGQPKRELSVADLSYTNVQKPNHVIAGIRCTALETVQVLHANFSAALYRDHSLFTELGWKNDPLRVL